MASCQARLLGGQLSEGFERRVPLALLRVQRGAVVPQQRTGRLQIGGRALLDQVLQRGLIIPAVTPSGPGCVPSDAGTHDQSSGQHS